MAFEFADLEQKKTQVSELLGDPFPSPAKHVALDVAFWRLVTLTFCLVVPIMRLNDRLGFSGPLVTGGPRAGAAMEEAIRAVEKRITCFMTSISS